MKTLLPLALASLLLASPAYAQDERDRAERPPDRPAAGAILRVDTGLAVPTGRAMDGADMSMYEGFGPGLPITALIGYYFTPRLGFTARENGPGPAHENGPGLCAAGDLDLVRAGASVVT